MPHNQGNRLSLWNDKNIKNIECRLSSGNFLVKTSYYDVMLIWFDIYDKSINSDDRDKILQQVFKFRTQDITYIHILYLINFRKVIHGKHKL